MNERGRVMMQQVQFLHYHDLPQSLVTESVRFLNFRATVRMKLRH